MTIPASTTYNNIGFWFLVMDAGLGYGLWSLGYGVTNDPVPITILASMTFNLLPFLVA
jgi:hypothetical protein